MPIQPNQQRQSAECIGGTITKNIIKNLSVCFFLFLVHDLSFSGSGPNLPCGILIPSRWSWGDYCNAEGLHDATNHGCMPICSRLTGSGVVVGCQKVVQVQVTISTQPFRNCKLIFILGHSGITLVKSVCKLIFILGHSGIILVKSVSFYLEQLCRYMVHWTL